ncbi:YhgE/Pip domain-containing protein [Clostridium gasigenes]|uniref:YhgE/Pip domain-containing protein n=1 Tax=Clostridium gasigenes TaxID=94869 RepID=UPI001C0C10A8|nr:YhgE/Pip domain-containing protein [Clostridium gasigenes]MBU3089369.1 YhgE/Pip domain-containing protein [Clostridium gasigenes]
MNFLKIAGNDIKSIFKNRFIRVSVIAIIIVPLLYSLLYLDAFWDPYSRLSKMPVAVVNLDEGSSLDGKNVNYGQDVVDNLKEDENLGWKFVTEEQADKGLEGDDYYAKFVIPKNFSSSTLAAKEGAPQVADLKFVCNEKKNFLASQINSKVEGLLKEQITSTISNQYLTVAFEKLYEVKDGMVQAADGSKQIYDGMAQLNEKVPMLEDGTKKLADGSSQLNDGQGKLNNGVSAISTGLGTLSGKIPTLSSGIDQLYGGSNELKNGILTAKDGSSKLADGSKSLYSAFNGTVYPAVKQLQDGANLLSSKLGAESAKADIATLSNGALGLKPVSDKLAGSSTLIKAGYGDVKTGIDEVIGGVNASSQTMDSVGKDLIKAMQSPDSKDKDANIAIALGKLKALQDKNKDTPKKLGDLKNGSDLLSSKLNEFDGGMQVYTGKVKEFAAGTTKLIGSVAEVNGGVNQISGGLNKLEAGINESTPGSFGNGLKAVSDNMSGLNTGLVKLNGGANQISGGLNDLKSNIPALSQGVTALYSGSKDLMVGSNALVDGQTKLNTGVKELSAKVPELKDGVVKLYDGSEELKTKLADGATEIKAGLINSPETMGEYIGEPAEMNVEPINPIPNYGTGFAPYFIALSLWIGAIMMFFVIPTQTHDDENLSKFDKIAGKFVAFGFIGVMQAILVSVVVLTLGLKPGNVPVYIGLTIFFSLVFISIIQCLISLLGDAGRLLGIVLLILQLTACAGTFPLELVPNMFKVLNPYMPFTYVVEAYREVISATVIDYSVIVKDVSILAIVLVVFLTISIVFKNAGEKFQSVIEGRKEKRADEIAADRM